MKIQTLKKWHGGISEGRFLALAFTFGFLSGGLIVSVLEVDLFTTLNTSSKTLILNTSHSIYASLLSNIAKLRVRASLTSSFQQRARLLCWIMTTVDNHQSKAFHVKTTWGKHCDILLFMSDRSDVNLPAVDLKVGAGRESLWAKTVKAFLYVHTNFKNDYDWVIKADDDTFMLIENVRKMLLPYSSNEKLFFGYNLIMEINHTFARSYASGGAGYILSKSSVEIFVDAQINRGSVNEDLCPNSTDGGPEDYFLGICLDSLDVKLVDTRDHKGRYVFFPLYIELMMFPASTNMSTNWWLFENSYWPISKSGRDTFTSRYVSTHYMPSELMYNFNYLLYTTKYVTAVENFASLKQNTTIFEQESLSKVNYSGIEYS